MAPYSSLSLRRIASITGALTPLLGPVSSIRGSSSHLFKSDVKSVIFSYPSGQHSANAALISSLIQKFIHLSLLRADYLPYSGALQFL